MAMSVVYSNFCGRVVSETRGGVESDYISDPLGSTIGLMGSAGTMTDRWEYWPFGEVISRTGTNVTPLTFLGVLGYFQDVLSKLSYVRARHLRVDLARWLTVDPMWPRQLAYAYSSNSPAVLTDPSGMVTPQGSGSTTFPLGLLFGLVNPLVALSLIGYTATVSWSYSWTPCSAKAVGVGPVDILGGGAEGFDKVYAKFSAGHILDGILGFSTATLVGMVCTAFTVGLAGWLSVIIGILCSGVAQFILDAYDINPGSECKAKDGTRCFWARIDGYCDELPRCTGGCC